MDFTADEYARRDADRLREILSGPPVTWVFLGDSITQGVAHTRGHRNYVEHFAERVRGELGRRGDTVVNSGVSGATAEDLLSEFHWRAGRFAPDVVFAMYGTNDILAGEDGVRGFRYRMDQIVQRSRDVGATVVLQTPPPVLEGEGRTPRHLALYAEAVLSPFHAEQVDTFIDKWYGQLAQVRKGLSADEAQGRSNPGKPTRSAALLILQGRRA